MRLLNLQSTSYEDFARLYFTGTDYTINLIPHAIIVVVAIIGQTIACIIVL